MKFLFRSPFYLLFALAACGYLGAANVQGWALLQALAMSTGGKSASHGAPIRHK